MVVLDDATQNKSWLSILLFSYHLAFIELQLLPSIFYCVPFLSSHIRDNEVLIVGIWGAPLHCYLISSLFFFLLFFSTYSELHSYKGDDPQLFFDRFFNLQADLTQTKLVVQSLTNISPLRTLDTNVNSIGSVKQVLDLAVQRKKNATSWIKSAMAFDLAPAWTSSLRNTTSNTHAAKTLKKPSSTTTSRVTKPKGSCITRKQQDNEITVGLIAEKDDPLDWVKGGTFSSAADLVNALEVESRRSFLNYAQKFVVWVESKASMMDSDSGVAGMMYQIKKVSDLLDIISKEANSEKNGSRESLTLEDSEVEACRRVRNKIYEVLLKHAERTALALENMTAAG